MEVERARQLSVFQLVASNAHRGAETFALELARELHDRGHHVATWAVRSSPDVEVLPVPILGSRAFSPGVSSALRRLARPVDVLVAHGSVTLPVSVAALAGVGTPIVYRNIGDPLYWAPTRLRRWRTRVLLGRVDHVVALVPAASRALHAHFGVRDDRVTVIPNGASATAFTPPTADQRRAARAHLGLGEHESVVVFVGRLSEEKNARLALDAVSRLPDTTLLVVGDGPQRAELEARAGSEVKFVGALDDPRPAYRAADVFVMSSNTEGLPGALIEAGLCGLPAVVTDVGYVRDVVEDEVTGFVVPPRDPGSLADALGTALARRGPLGAAARARCADRFSLARVADDWSALLTRVSGR